MSFRRVALKNDSKKGVGSADRFRLNWWMETNQPLLNCGKVRKRTEKFWLDRLFKCG